MCSAAAECFGKRYSKKYADSIRTPRRFVSPARRPLRSSLRRRPSSRSTPRKFCRMQRCVVHEKRRIAAAKFHFERLWLWKNLRKLQRFDDGAKLVNEIRLRLRGNCHGRIFNQPSPFSNSFTVPAQAPLAPDRTESAHSCPLHFASCLRRPVKPDRARCRNNSAM